MSELEQAWQSRSKKKDEVPESFLTWQQFRKPEHLKQVVKDLAPTIDSAMNSFARTQSPIVRQRASLLAAKAVQSYTPGRGTALNTHVFNHLQQLSRVAPKVEDPLSPSERARRTGGKLFSAMNELNEYLGREPTDEELSEASGLSVKQVAKFRRQYRTATPMGLGSQSDDEDTEPDLIESERTPYDDWVEAVYTDLGDVDRRIFSYRTGFRGETPLSNNEIARRLNVSPAFVSQRAAWIQRRLDEFDV